MSLWGEQGGGCPWSRRPADGNITAFLTVTAKARPNAGLSEDSGFTAAMSNAHDKQRQKDDGGGEGAQKPAMGSGKWTVPTAGTTQDGSQFQLAIPSRSQSVCEHLSTA